MRVVFHLPVAPGRQELLLAGLSGAEVIAGLNDALVVIGDLVRCLYHLCTGILDSADIAALVAHCSASFHRSLIFTAASGGKTSNSCAYRHLLLAYVNAATSIGILYAHHFELHLLCLTCLFLLSFKFFFKILLGGCRTRIVQ